jgi:hypothetical protein
MLGLSATGYYNIISNSTKKETLLNPHNLSTFEKEPKKIKQACAINFLKNSYI